ncbi:c-type cytochrome [Mucilaginibacter sp. HMF5004]|uniref:c-type cytochrome n=1 Tax=Mucilaginibacter rivuli TaxID=2857527 RepID=UPI001C5E30B3|nr:c-type cytochrome [Mucilaginibacter rivuli]MBW4889335.1 c-type cytochrome [Mucilaginibacter rivuli]
MLSHKKLLITLSLSSVVVFITATAMKSSQQEQQDEKFKNLKVLPKDISKDDLEKVMHSWNDALGVRCNFCHARNAETNKMDMASDAKPEKEMAREMMKMTEQINKKYFKPEKEDKEHKDDMMAAVNCMTCHHGSAHPNSAAAKPNGFGPPQGGFGQPGGQGQQAPPVKQ